eukprot:Blabericola_migrator_1__9288@NODE_499_length_8005_cov_262_271857_g382_i0_p4_GENE_NODE_499_length_8005_cov_262_271857_g382_i0NODE_499_length_8005_cov_262_271857_g382_i0_p4_ORF_typecomplete_len272_score35_31_NODE_499_length_8005_cov_262_271857_g382_i09761791
MTRNQVRPTTNLIGEEIENAATIVEDLNEEINDAADAVCESVRLYTMEPRAKIDKMMTQTMEVELRWQLASLIDDAKRLSNKSHSDPIDADLLGELLLLDLMEKIRVRMRPGEWLSKRLEERARYLMRAAWGSRLKIDVIDETQAYLDAVSCVAFRGRRLLMNGVRQVLLMEVYQFVESLSSSCKRMYEKSGGFATCPRYGECQTTLKKASWRLYSGGSGSMETILEETNDDVSSQEDTSHTSFTVSDRDPEINTDYSIKSSRRSVLASAM